MDKAELKSDLNAAADGALSAFAGMAAAALMAARARQEDRVSARITDAYPRPGVAMCANIPLSLRAARAGAAGGKWLKQAQCRHHG